MGATLVTMLTGHPLNHEQSRLIAPSHIGKYDLLYDGTPLNEALKKMSDGPKRLILRNSLCKPEFRASAKELLAICNFLW